MNCLIVVFSLVFAVVANGQHRPCIPSQRGAVTIHWSEGGSIFSPDCKWLIEIRTVGEDGPAEAYLREIRHGGVPRLLFSISRDGVIHWGEQDTALLIEDMQFSNRYRVMLFDPLDQYQSQREALQIDEIVRANVDRELEQGEDINYYFPRFVDWTDNRLILSVGVTTVRGESGPFTRHCFGYEFSARPLKLKGAISEVDLKKRYGASCQIWP